MNLISWNTLRRRQGITNCPRYYDGLVNSYESVNPYLVKNGFEVIGEESDYNLLDNDKPKKIAMRILMDNGIAIETDARTFVYHCHYGSRINAMMDAITVYARECREGGAE